MLPPYLVIVEHRPVPTDVATLRTVFIVSSYSVPLPEQSAEERAGPKLGNPEAAVYQVARWAPAGRGGDGDGGGKGVGVEGEGGGAGGGGGVEGVGLEGGGGEAAPTSSLVPWAEGLLMELQTTPPSIFAGRSSHRAGFWHRTISSHSDCEVDASEEHT